MRDTILAVVIIINALCGILVYFMPQMGNYILLTIASCVSILAFYDAFIQKKHSLMRSFPVISRLRWVFEEEREKIQQYFIEDDLNGTPINREKRSIVYQRSKKEIETVPFGTQHNLYEKGYEFVKHSLFPKDHHHIAGERVVFGSDKCTQKYDASIINISAMSFGSLSKNAIMALNQGAKMADFAHNTGEGGISPHHLQGGDLIFQVGTGYFGAGKSVNGKRVFDADIFKENAIRPEVKMIEIKFSQGAKPGHGGILPAKKNTEEIAKIRAVEPFTRVDSPPGHSAFSNFDEMIVFIQKVRDLSEGKPVGIKFCVGDNDEIEAMIKAFVDANNYPDFISVDGGEGGTGSAPIEFSNYVGTPLLDGLAFVTKTLRKYKLKDQIKIIASGKAIDAFDIVKYKALGADAIGMARSFMLSLGCIQARECNLDTCPVGVATQEEDLVEALVVADKNIRVKNYHDKTIDAVKEVVAAMGKNSITDVKASHVFRRNKAGEIQSLDAVYDLQ
ncbi:FMN-binding glutamate synthase family protein [Tenacibaculum finnmarkense]|uniref:FMN-binding glutamate synthase family protein n=1 Tax=Tenacibaculum finnmarkense TaxID=2781243 RepID=UPI00187B8C72|nr:FMN-binding glutamate synthase family protein [Tenacibaculum finnmarkense]MBE7660816.1 FMN-binding glutamate synthase family protein [Tenacibaculum finnmarkense genomovar finnmarkense]MCG8252448.1 FMN-binding glutamate synthase family protein [Tenacibaculum finnmarkense genomovar finnmarkense]MCG8814875.1 FMN-binding glutamate synthase family protein [Tenacibaculum finnmarkense]MCG8820894.1 FMN-binding glutamate synthase family protein [Tenacibaculum finnmarkense]